METMEVIHECFFIQKLKFCSCFATGFRCIIMNGLQNAFNANGCNKDGLGSPKKDKIVGTVKANVFRFFPHH